MKALLPLILTFVLSAVSAMFFRRFLVIQKSFRRLFSTGPPAPISVVWFEVGTYRRKPTMRLQTEEAVRIAAGELKAIKLRSCRAICKAEIR